MDGYSLAFYPRCGGPLDLLGGIRAWQQAGGQLKGRGSRLQEIDPVDNYLFFGRAEHIRFDPDDLAQLAELAAGYCVEVKLNGPFYTPDITAIYYHHAPVDPLIQWGYGYPHRWGLGPGGLPAAYNALFAFAHAAGAAYVLTSTPDAHERMRQQFVFMDTHYEFDLPPELVATGHQMLALDVNPALGAILPADTPTLATEVMPHGYTRHWLRGHSPPEFSDDWPRLKRPGPRPLLNWRPE